MTYLQAYHMVKRGAKLSPLQQYKDMYGEIIRLIQSSNNPNAVGDKGKAVGLYQMHPSYFNDYMRLTKRKLSLKDRKNPAISGEVFRFMNDHYNKLFRQTNGRDANHLELAGWHNGGYRSTPGVREQTLGYAKKVRDHFKRLTGGKYQGIGNQAVYIPSDNIVQYEVKRGDTLDSIFKSLGGFYGTDKYHADTVQLNPNVRLPRSRIQNQRLQKQLKQGKIKQIPKDNYIYPGQRIRVRARKGYTYGR